ncbi:hypothetical protein MHM88_14560 [Epibacterium sp. MM17-32]|uniref:hypothetical protein n=1 Tax=Epibacterium sp. MM17-32 TaxID=2917734 RepID=UPI001EF3DE55|nr:hypothetical protein [Epibacterium sp. MM17-32]MCG7629030.1 hypothetical protein [Epibacterium sp. MM17-32]
MKCTEIKTHQLLLTEREHAELGKYPFTKEIELEAAMCAWEALIDRRKEPWEGGAAQGRYCCGNLALAIHIGYCVANVDDRLDGFAYDWDFVPWFIGTCVKWDTAAAYISGTPELVDNWLDLCRTCLVQPVPEPSDEDLLRDALNLIAPDNPLAQQITRRLAQ